VFCNNCGHRNPPGANFCSSCGGALEHPTGEESTVTLAAVEGADPGGDDDIAIALDELPEGLGLVVVKRGPNAGSKFTLDHPVTTAGRHPESDIFLDDITVSRRHAEFRRSNKGYTVADVGSLNGTYLNRARIEDAALANGDEVQIGKYRLVFLTGSSPDQ
jgi:pSer/pThr/pTyr-binding forkhead associated (FHA) protein